MYFMPHQNIKPTAIALVDAFPVSTGKDAAQKYSVDRIRGALKSRKKLGLNFVFGRRFRPQELIDNTLHDLLFRCDWEAKATEHNPSAICETIEANTVLTTAAQAAGVSWFSDTGLWNLTYFDGSIDRPFDESLMEYCVLCAATQYMTYDTFANRVESEKLLSDFQSSIVRVVRNTQYEPINATIPPTVLAINQNIMTVEMFGRLYRFGANLETAICTSQGFEHLGGFGSNRTTFYLARQ